MVRRSEAHVRSQPRLRDVLFGPREARRGGGGEVSLDGETLWSR